MQEPEVYEPPITEEAFEALEMAIRALGTDTNVGTKDVPDINVGDMISRQAAIDALRTCYDTETITMDNGDEYINYGDAVGEIEQLPPIQPTDNLQKLADEIASFKRCVKSDNSDYLTGYMCALSVVEGMIADMREVTT